MATKLTIGEEEPLMNYAKAIVSELRANFVRCYSDFSSNKINGKIQEAEVIAEILQAIKERRGN